MDDGQVSIIYDDAAINRALAQSPYRLLSAAAAESDPTRFFRGLAATSADIEAGWGISRSLTDGHQTLSFEAFVPEFQNAGGGSLYLLAGTTGEGKTTFIRQLAYRLRQKGVRTLRWDRTSEHNPTLLNSLLKKQIESVIICDLQPNLSSSALPQIAVYLDAEPLPVPALIAGEPADLSACAIRGARYFRFARIDDAAAHELTAQLKRVLAVAQERGLDLDDAFPNLQKFANNPDETVFTSEDTLFVGLLRATYGTDFRAKLAREYERLARDETAQAVYRIACYASAAGLDLPTRLLGTLVPGITDALLGRFARGGPWELAGQGYSRAISARNQTIAQTVVEEAGLLRADLLDHFFQPLIESTDRPDVSFLWLLRTIFGRYADWISATGRADQARRKALRRIVRSALLAKRESLERARTLVCHLPDSDWGVFGSWAALMFRLLPRLGQIRRQSSRRDRGIPVWRAVLAESLAWLNAAELRAPPHFRSTITYLQAKNRLWGAYVDGIVPATRAEVLVAWEGIYDDRERLGPAFLADLARAAKEHAAGELTDSDRLHWQLAAARAYEELFSRWPRQAETKSAEIDYSLLLSDAEKRLPREAFRALLRAGWEASVAAGKRNHRTGTKLARELIGIDSTDAVTILKAILDQCRWGDALLMLARLGGSEPSLLEYVAEYSEKHAFPDEWGNSWSRALAAHALALVAAEAPERQRTWLNAACAEYALVAGEFPQRFFKLHGGDWKEAIELLAQLDEDAASERMREWQDTEAKAEKQLEEKPPPRGDEVDSDDSGD